MNDTGNTQDHFKKEEDIGEGNTFLIDGMEISVEFSDTDMSLERRLKQIARILKLND